MLLVVFPRLLREATMSICSWITCRMFLCFLSKRTSLLPALFSNGQAHGTAQLRFPGAEGHAQVLCLFPRLAKGPSHLGNRHPQGFQGLISRT